MYFYSLNVPLGQNRSFFGDCLGLSLRWELTHFPVTHTLDLDVGWGRSRENCSTGGKGWTSVDLVEEEWKIKGRREKAGRWPEAANKTSPWPSNLSQCHLSPLKACWAWFFLNTIWSGSWVCIWQREKHSLPESTQDFRSISSEFINRNCGESWGLPRPWSCESEIRTNDPRGRKPQPVSTVQVWHVLLNVRVHKTALHRDSLLRWELGCSATKQAPTKDAESRALHLPASTLTSRVSLELFVDASEP